LWKKRLGNSPSQLCGLSKELAESQHLISKLPLKQTLMIPLPLLSRKFVTPSPKASLHKPQGIYDLITPTASTFNVIIIPT